VGVLFAARLSVRSLSAQVLVQQIVLLLYMIMLSMGDAGNTLIGQYLGAHMPMKAANAKNVIYTLSAILLMINVSFILVSYRWLPFLFDIEPNALSLARHGLLLAAVVNIFDGFYVVHTGMVKAW
jgi:Na+-driven multidrug efflux pump